MCSNGMPIERLGLSNIALRWQKLSYFAKQRNPELECSKLQGMYVHIKYT